MMRSLVRRKILGMLKAGALVQGETIIRASPTRGLPRRSEVISDELWQGIFALKWHPFRRQLCEYFFSTGNAACSRGFVHSKKGLNIPRFPRLGNVWNINAIFDYHRVPVRLYKVPGPRLENLDNHLWKLYEVEV